MDGPKSRFMKKKLERDAVSVDRTRDLQIFSLTLSQLSYPRNLLIIIEICPLWRPYFPNKQGLIFVVDSNDRDRVVEARDEFHSIYAERSKAQKLKNQKDGLRDGVLQVFANKQDLPNPINAAEITDKLGLHSLRQRHWYIQSTCATSGGGIYKGLDRLSNNITNKLLIDSEFSAGATVEVRTKVESFGIIWAPAITIKENEDGTLLVKYKSLSGGEDEWTKKSVPYSEVRPSPPPFDGKFKTIYGVERYGAWQTQEEKSSCYFCRDLGSKMVNDVMNEESNNRKSVSKRKREQQPPSNFSPLLECEEEFREGEAIGAMVNFTGLLEKVRDIQVHDSVSAINRIRDCFLKLEKHGFDVTAPRSRIHNILCIKECQTWALKEVQYAERMITEKGSKRRKLQDDIELVSKKIVELRRQEALLKEEKVTNEKEIARMKSHAVVLDRKVQSVEQDFMATVSPPWY
ncbi:unnamed protein product [Brassica napus]|uniref:(rape) hypothetical protein n=1 Tax=Brassica napus TaxID=3708 RepID=A0A816YVB5_BRANA|nr:unnamed protein product [Brassica napus]